MSASDLSVTYPGGGGRDAFLALNGLTFDVAEGSTLGIVGESGSGKSTFLRVLAGETGPSAAGVPSITGGDVTVLGTRMRRASRRRRTRLSATVGYLAQNAGSALDPQLTVGENIASPIFARDRRFDEREAGRRVFTLVDAVALPSSVLALFPHELSSGQRQRVAIARSLVLGPRLWVADEPTAGIDVLGRDAVLDLLRGLQQRAGFSAVIGSHDIAVASRLSSRLVLLNRGVMVGLGTIDDLLTAPDHPYVAGLKASLADAERGRAGPGRAGSTQAGGTQANGTQANGTQANGTQENGTQADFTRADGTQANGVDVQ